MPLPRSAAALALVAAVSMLSAPVIVSGVKPTVALILIVACLAALVLSRDAPVAGAFVVAVLGVSATLDLVRRVDLGPVTAYAWLTGAVALCAAFLAVVLAKSSVPSAGRHALALMTLFPLWTLLAASWSGPDASGFQNILMYMLFPSVAAVSAVATAMGELTFATLRKLMAGTFIAGSALYAGSLLLEGPGGHAVVDPRPYATFAAVGVAWSVALTRYGYRAELRLAVAMVALAFLSLSRASFAVAVLILVVGMFGLGSIRSMGRTLATLATLVVLVVAGIHFANPFAARFSEPDVVALPGGVHLSVSGRGALWEATWRSALQSPVVGKGAGSNRVPLAGVAENEGHPHNDYLRVFHDYGLVGLALLLCALAAPGLLAARSLRRAPPTFVQQRAVHLAAILALAVLALEMITDNSLVYPFVIIPVAVMVGTSLANSDRDARSLPVAHRS